MIRRRRLPLACAAALVACAPIAAGCGGGGAPGIASVRTSTSTASPPRTGAVAYAGCMRSHGVANFPDPNSSGRFTPTALKSLRVGKSRFKGADTACTHLLPGGLGGAVAPPQDSAQQTRTRIADELSFARCMRAHGLGRFPDPTAQGELSIEMVQAQGIDVRSTVVLRIVQACLPASHGALTPAKVREALSQAHG
jgi:hypothetical protein